MKTRQRIASSIITFSMFCLLLPSIVYAQTDISFSPTNTEARTGEVIDIDLHAVSDSDMLYSGDIYLEYDRNILEVMQPELSAVMNNQETCSSTTSPPWSGFGERDEGARIWFGRGSCEPIDVSTETRILALRFTATSSGLTAVSLKQDVEWGLNSASSTPIATSTITVGSFSVEVLSDTDPPVISNPYPAETLPSGTTSTIMSVDTDEVATCKYNAGSDTDYASMDNTFDTTGSTSHETILAGLTDGSSYNYYIRCQDNNGNSNTSGELITFDIAAPTPTISLTPDPATVDEGSQATVSLMVSDAASLDTILVDIAYNTSVLTYDSYSVGADTTDWVDLMADEMTSGTISITADNFLGGSSLSGDVEIINLTFNADSPGISGLAFDSAGAMVVSGSPSTDWDDGQIIVEEVDEIAPEVVIAEPTTDSTYAYNSASSDITISGTSTDNTAVDYLEWENSATAATGTVTGTSSWSADIGLSEGENPVTVTAYDAAGNSASTSLNITYNRAPAISGIQAGGIGTSDATISWTTDINAASQVEYGNSQSLGSQTSVDSSLTTNHSIQVDGLSSGTTYHYRVISEAATGATAMSTIRTFTTDSTSSSSGSSGGGGGSTYTPPPNDDDEPYEQPSSVRSEVSGEAITISWTNPVAGDFEKTIIVRTNEQISDYMTYSAISGMGDTVYEGSEESFTDHDVSPNLDYYYAVFSANDDNTYSEPTILRKSAGAQSRDEAPENGSSLDNNTGNKADNHRDLKNLANVDSRVVNQVSRREAVEVMEYNQQVPLNDTTRALYDFIISKRKSDLAEKERYAVAYYIHYGTQTTKWLGAGERTGVVNSYRSAFGRLPRTDSEWQDVIKIANGRWPDERSQAAELNAKTQYFVAVYKRMPNMDNTNDNAAVTVIAYGLRPADRNMDSETQAISIFRTIYGYTPESAVDWDIVRSIAYSGATR